MDCWLYESRLYENRTIAQYMAMWLRDDRLLEGNQQINVKVFRTRNGRYGIKYKI